MTVRSASPFRLSWRKRALFSVVIALGVGLFVELASWVAVLMLHGSFGRLAGLRRDVAVRDPIHPPAGKDLPLVIHPYLGATLQPIDEGSPAVEGGCRITEFGFCDQGSPIHRRSRDRVIVGILGGSVARQLATYETGVIERQLAELPRFSGRSFEFVRLAVDGYKQPQQLMAISYLLALGAEFDIVINLDGVNESALPKMDNVPFGVSAAYPRKWGELIAASGSVETSRIIGYVAYLRHRQSDTARLFDAIPWRYSPTASLVWASLNERGNQLVVQQVEAISAASAKEISYCASGPPEHFESDEQLYRHCVDLWARSSVQLHRLCAANGIQYFHFLQPNQYLANTKPIGEEEAAIALSELSPFRVPVMRCYPLMRSRSDELTAAGVEFIDLTRVFSDHSEPIYKDNCCHVLEAGDRLMAQAIAQHIRRFYTARGPE